MQPVPYAGPESFRAFPFHVKATRGQDVLFDGGFESRREAVAFFDQAMLDILRAGGSWGPDLFGYVIDRRDPDPQAFIGELLGGNLYYPAN